MRGNGGRSHLTSPLDKPAEVEARLQIPAFSVSVVPIKAPLAPWLQHGILWRGEQRLRTLSPAEDQGVLQYYFLTADPEITLLLSPAQLTN